MIVRAPWLRWLTASRTGMIAALALALVLFLLLREVLSGSSMPVLRVAAGPKSGEPYKVAAAIASVVNARTDAFRLEVLATTDSQGSALRLTVSEAELALVQSGVVGRNNIALVAKLYPDMYQLLVRRGSGIKTIKDLEGRNLALPPVFSGQYRAFWVLANHYGLTTRRMFAVSMDDEEAVAAMLSGEVDAIFRVRGPRNNTIRSLISKADVQFLAIDQGEAMRLRKPVLSTAVIPKGSYRGTPPLPARALPTIAVDRLLLARVDIDAGYIRTITRILFEERRYLLARTPLASFIRQPKTGDGTLLPLHDGAAAYYDREKPSFLEEKAELLAFVLSALVVLISAGLALRRFLGERKQGRVEDYTAMLIELEKEAKSASTIPELNVYKDRLTEMLGQVVQDMRDHKIAGEGLQFFAFVWRSVNDTINDHEEQLRLGPTTHRDVGQAHSLADLHEAVRDETGPGSGP